MTILRSAVPGLFPDLSGDLALRLPIVLLFPDCSRILFAPLALRLLLFFAFLFFYDGQMCYLSHVLQPFQKICSRIVPGYFPDCVGPDRQSKAVYKEALHLFSVQGLLAYASPI